MSKNRAFVAATLTFLLVLTACAPASQAPAGQDGVAPEEPTEPSATGGAEETSVAPGASDTTSPIEAGGVEAVVASAGPSAPSFRLLVSDEANDIGDFSELWVLVSGVGFVPGGEGGVVEYLFDEPVQLNLVPLVDENAIALWEGYVPEGTYNKVFLYVDEVYGIPLDPEEGETLVVQLPSSKLQVNVPVTVGDEEEGKSTEYVFDVSVHEAGNSGKYILQPQLTESGEGKLYRLQEQTQDSVRKGKPEWAGKPGGDDDDEDEDDEDEDDEEDGNDDQPSIDVEVEAEAVEGAVLSTVTIENSSEVEVTVLGVTSNVYWQLRGNAWEYLEELADDTGYTIAAGDTLTLEFEIPCDVPDEARELRIEARVEIDGRDKVFRDTESFAPWGYVREIELEGTIGSLDPLTVTTDEGDTYIVVTNDDTEIEGELAPGGEVEVEGVLRPDGTVLAFEIEGEEEEAED